MRIEAAYDPWTGYGETGSDDGAPPAIVLAHGFTGSLDRPALRRAARVLARHAAVVTFSFRGHGGSGGRSTVGDREVLDLAAAVRWARSLGHGHITTVGFSMGGSVVVRHGALYPPYEPGGPGTCGTDEEAGGNTAQPPTHKGRTGAHLGADALPLGVRDDPASAAGARPAPAPAGSAPVRAGEESAHADAVVTVSAPARWYYRGTAPMRRLHWVIQRPVGRLVSRYGLRTRVHPYGWAPEPLSPTAAAPALAPRPLLVVHGDQDPYFPLDHPRSLAEAAAPGSTELWIEPGFGHAENAAAPALLHRIGAWSRMRYGSARAARHDGTRAN